MADVDATFGQQILDLPQRQRKPDMHHHRAPDDLGLPVEMVEGISHRCKLWNATSRLKLICSDTAGGGRNHRDRDAGKSGRSRVLSRAATRPKIRQTGFDRIAVRLAGGP